MKVIYSKEQFYIEVPKFILKKDCLYKVIWRNYLTLWRDPEDIKKSFVSSEGPDTVTMQSKYLSLTPLKKTVKYLRIGEFENFLRTGNFKLGYRLLSEDEISENLTCYNLDSDWSKVKKTEKDRLEDKLVDQIAFISKGL